MRGLRRPSLTGSRRAARLTALALAGAAFAACQDEPAAPTGLAASNMQTASCRDWDAASPQERRATVDRLEEIVAGPRREGSTLPDDVAYSTIDGRCRPDFAKGFLLYGIYIRAAGFQSLAEQAGER